MRTLPSLPCPLSSGQTALPASPTLGLLTSPSTHVACFADLSGSQKGADVAFWGTFRVPSGLYSLLAAAQHLAHCGLLNRNMSIECLIKEGGLDSSNV